MTLVETLLASVRSHAERTYLVAYDEAALEHGRAVGDRDGRRSWSYRAFLDDALRLASLYRRLGVVPGDRVGSLAGNRPEVLLHYFACWLLGAVACPINAGETAARKRFILEAAGCRLVVVEAQHAEGLERVAAELDAPPQRLPLETLLADARRLEPFAPRPLPAAHGAFQVYTSGTTGQPKGVLLSHGNLLANAGATAAWHGLAPGDGMMTVLPIHHVNGAIVTGLTPFLAGGRNILCPRFSPRSFWPILAAEGAALASLVPTLLEFLLSADERPDPEQLPALRYFLCGAGPLLCETVTRFEETFGVPICHGFGMSETTAYNTQFPMALPAAERRRLYREYGFPSVGCALACNEVGVQREDGSEAEPLERGEIVIRGPTVMAGYLNDDEANRRAFRNGWFRSGDQGFYVADEDGRRHFFLSGRIKELIIRGGVNLSPLEIDEVLRRRPGVAFALAVPFVNTFYGEEIAAYVVPRPGATLDADELLAAARAELGFARSPKVVLIGNEVPFTATGKPQRLALAERLAPQLERYREVQFRKP